MKNPTTNSFETVKGLLKDVYGKKKMSIKASAPKPIQKMKFKLLEGLNKGSNFTKK